MNDLSPDQARAADAVEAFVRDSANAESRTNRSCFVLHGLAGTGKTHLWAHLAAKYPGAILVTPTGKAASVLRKRSGLPVRTIHSAIYDFRGLVDDEEVKNKKNPVFVDKSELDLSKHVVFLDEASMVGSTLANDLLRTGATVVACGDPGQLPPVMDAQFFTEPDATLTAIHRQALESPIVRQAHNVRGTGEYESDGEGFRVVSFAEPEMILEADILLCWMNVTRRRLNAKKRTLLGLSGFLKKGEPVMCLKNNHTLGIYNGEIYRLTEDRRMDTNLSIRGDDELSIHLALATVEGERNFEILKYNDRFTPFAPAYACTVHKAQGSEFPSVLLLDERPRGAERVPFLYTGITRAIERCTVVSWR